MTLSRRRFARCVSVAALLGPLAACGGLPDRDPPASGQPSMYRSLAQPEAQLDAAAAASMISGYRQNNGLSAVALDPALTRMAADHARAMAAANKMDHTIGGRGFAQRFQASGFGGRTGAENVGAGYHTLAEAFSGWRDSPGHRANMLKAGATHIGIAAVYAPNTKYKVFWCMVIAGT